MLDKGLNRRQISIRLAERIENQNNSTKAKKTGFYGKNCVCNICHEFRETLTLNHAESHGFVSKMAMIDAGAVRFV